MRRYKDVKDKAVVVREQLESVMSDDKKNNENNERNGNHKNSHH